MKLKKIIEDVFQKPTARVAGVGGYKEKVDSASELLSLLAHPQFMKMKDSLADHLTEEEWKEFDAAYSNLYQVLSKIENS